MIGLGPMKIYLECLSKKKDIFKILLLDVNIVRDGWCIQRFSPSYLEICAYKINWNSDLQNIFNESICQFCVDKINGKSILQNRYCWSVRDMWSVFGSLEIRLIFNVIIIIIITRSKPAYAYTWLSLCLWLQFLIRDGKRNLREIMILLILWT